MTIKKKTIYLSLTFLLSITLFSFYLIYPLTRKIDASIKGIISYKKQLFSLESQSGNTKQMRIEYQKIEKDIDRINQLFVTSDEPVEFIKFLEKLASESLAKINIIPTNQKEEKTICFQVSLQGQASGLFKFLEKLENSPYLIDIASLNMRKLVIDEKNKDEVAADLLIKVLTK